MRLFYGKLQPLACPLKFPEMSRRKNHKKSINNFVCDRHLSGRSYLPPHSSLPERCRPEHPGASRRPPGSFPEHTGGFPEHPGASRKPPGCLPEHPGASRKPPGDLPEAFRSTPEASQSIPELPGGFPEADRSTTQYRNTWRPQPVSPDPRSDSRAHSRLFGSSPGPIVVPFS